MQRSEIKLNVLGEDGATAPAPGLSVLHRHGAGSGPKAVLGLDVVSDVICPWCWVGKRRLAKALTLLGDEADVRVHWRPYQLNPAMPKEGIDRREYRTRKFGSWEYSQTLDARLVAVGRSEGLDFNFDRISRTPNTLDAHRLIRLAEGSGVQDAVVEALFRAYFADGVDIGLREHLVDVAASAGMPAADAERVLGPDGGVADVLAEERRYKGMGIEGVPAFVARGAIAVSGAADPRVMAGAFRDSAGGGEGPPAVASGAGTT
ncbi:MAG: Protein-disulfide isomerase [Phycisphaerales bacterium]|nr:Protein-disulfide isomerase [Phycisphaerales bacterium]